MSTTPTVPCTGGCAGAGQQDMPPGTHPPPTPTPTRQIRETGGGIGGGGVLSSIAQGALLGGDPAEADDMTGDEGRHEPPPPSIAKTPSDPVVQPLAFRSAGSAAASTSQPPATAQRAVYSFGGESSFLKVSTCDCVLMQLQIWVLLRVVGETSGPTWSDQDVFCSKKGHLSGSEVWQAMIWRGRGGKGTQ